MSAPHYVAFRVPDTDLHLTLVYIDALAPEERAALDADVAALPRPVRVRLGEREMFGEKHDIPVIVVTFVGDDAPFRAFYAKWYRPQPGTTRRDTPNWHISSPSSLAQTEITLSEIYVKKLGGKK